MKYVISSFFLIIFFSVSAQIPLKGKIIVQTTGDAVAYVNIGVVGMNVGTVTDLTGEFEMIIPEEFYNDLIRISIIGYESLETTTIELKSLIDKRKNIKLSPSTFLIDEVIIESSKLKSKVVGNKSLSRTVSAGFSANELGNEM